MKQSMAVARELFETYGCLYRSCNRMGESDALIKYLGCDASLTIPLSISHGVDFGHCHGAMDVKNREPVHWAYNEIIKNECEGVKPFVEMPHPWATIDNGDVQKGRGVLVIGPPPGFANDRALCSLLSKERIKKATVLVKARGGYKKSIEYWEGKGYEAVTVGERGVDFYKDLFFLLERFDRVIGCTFSSALIFSAAIGKKVDLLSGYSYEFYDVMGYLDRVNFSSERASRVVSTFSTGSYSEKSDLARSLLGYDYLDSKDKLIASLEGVFCDVLPVWVGGHPKIMDKIMIRLALAAKRPGLLDVNGSFFKGFYQRKTVVAQKINEIDIWLNGINSENFEQRIVPFVEGVTVPGFAVEQY